ncbi:hypothetical protein [Methylacidimicrobium sp. B4]|uniref:hypothetical protein n=1 Tax=Methylacidimicrobium sp. B4 TaxID=2796139 RepID=UPI001A8F7856|nr:hypothetical protein [Methylacidimicrobium sp. B4]QSR85101.1 hypothetical protein MacB4_02190 [Methylacidimicrobium sp. B4]
MRMRVRQGGPAICRIVFHGVGPAGPGWANFLLVEAARRAGATVFPPGVGWILPLFFSRLSRKPEAVFLFGYSRGGVSAVRLARFFVEEGIRVALLYLIDPVVIRGGALSLPASVERTFCCRQRNGARLWLLPGRLGRGAPCRSGRPAEPGLEEEEALCFPDGRPVYHEDMVRYALQHARLRLDAALTLGCFPHATDA